MNYMHFNNYPVTKCLFRLIVLTNAQLYTYIYIYNFTYMFINDCLFFYIIVKSNKTEAFIYAYDNLSESFKNKILLNELCNIN